MARLTYGVVAGALAALVAGFFIRYSTVPLVISISLSAAAVLLVMVGWGRRIRIEGEAIFDGISISDEPSGSKDGSETVEVGPRLPGVKVARNRTGDKTKAASPKKRTKAGTEKAGSKGRTRKKKTAAKSVVVVPGRRRYHSAGCRFASAAGAQRVPLATARRRKYEPCNVCRP